MKEVAKGALWATALAGLCCQTAMATDLSLIARWVGEYPSAKIVDNKTLWNQPEVQEAMRAAMGSHFFSPQKDVPPPEAPVQSDGDRLFAAWTCNNGDDCGGNNILVYFDKVVGDAQVCLRSSDGVGGTVHDVWLAHGEARPLPINGCGVGQRDPFAPLKKFGGR